MSGGAAAHGHTGKHSGTQKHEKTRKHHPTKHREVKHHEKHHVHAKGTHVKHAKARGYALAPWLLPACSLEAVAQSLRILGQPVHDDEVAWLWELAGGRELSIPEALALAVRVEIAGFRPVGIRPGTGEPVGGLDATQWRRDVPLLAPESAECPGDLLRGDLTAAASDVDPGRWPIVEEPGHLAAVAHATVDDLLSERVFRYLGDNLAEVPVGGRVGEYTHGVDAAQLKALVDLVDSPARVHALILGVDAPGPHAVLATPHGWWSWGELHDPWPCAIEEAWAVSWS